MSKVTVIAISYNHEPYIKEGLESVFAQAYADIELIVMDDGSSDESQEKIEEILGDREAKLIFHDENKGYTQTFNEGLSEASGEFIVDFALDDVMTSGFIEESVKTLREAGNDYGVVFSNAEYIDKNSQVTHVHTEWLKHKGIIDWVPEGDVFQMILRRYFICTPSMLIRKSVFDRIGGYDESLAYEDFDFWVRSSRYWKYAYTDQILIQKRKLKTSLSAQRFRHYANNQMRSVYQVCLKAAGLCHSKDDYQALSVRLNYEYRQCLRHGAWDLAQEYVSLLRQNRLRFDLASLVLGWFGFRLRLKLK